MAAKWGTPEWEEETKHINPTLDSFRFWGNKIGFIGGQIKSKWGECRWYANLNGITCLHDIFKVGHHYYRWDPGQGGVYILLDFLNNLSRLFFGFPGVRRLTAKWQILFYNIAYWNAMLKFPDRAYEIICNGDYDELIWFKPRVWARKKGIEAGTLDWLLKIEAEDAQESES